MIVKKPGIFLAACNSLQAQSFTGSASSTSSSPQRRRDTRHQACRPRCLPTYATIAGDARQPGERKESQAAAHEWPQATTGHTHPTPYQIFNLEQSATYSKAKYYALVKIYHPDRHGGSTCAAHQQESVERYRLIVAAHAILSDPAKRSAYDRFGAGWDGKAEVGDKATWAQPSPYHPAGPFSQSCSDPSDPVWQNATWEDWERWRLRKDGINPEKRAPVYMANSYFLAVIVALAVMGSSWNYNRAQDAGHYFVEQRDIVHDKAAKDLRRLKNEVSTVGTRDDRIQYFLRHRGAAIGQIGFTDVEALREERANRVLKDKEICASENVSGQAPETDD